MLPATRTALFFYHTVLLIINLLLRGYIAQPVTQSLAIQGPGEYNGRSRLGAFDTGRSENKHHSA